MPDDFSSAWLIDRVPGYRELTSAERQEIANFAMIWSLFEAKMLDKRGSVRKIEEKAEAWSIDAILQHGRFRTALGYFRARYTADGSETPAFRHLRFGPRDKRELVKAILLGEQENAQNTVVAILIIIYRLRNNFFHGEKWADNIRNQRENFFHANLAMTTIIEIQRHL